jgi:hypothetical protein
MGPKKHIEKLALEAMSLYKNDLFIAHYQLEKKITPDEFEKNKTDFYDFCIMYSTGEGITGNLFHEVNIEIQNIKRGQELALAEIEDDIIIEQPKKEDLDLARKMKKEYKDLGGGAGVEAGKEYYNKIMYD